MLAWLGCMVFVSASASAGCVPTRIDSISTPSLQKLFSCSRPGWPGAARLDDVPYRLLQQEVMLRCCWLSWVAAATMLAGNVYFYSRLSHVLFCHRHQLR